ncbi:hypothetical protein B0H14DRAFT_3864704 [Mycena olivaceomarginata]|nr:hypothetical protein B0H14DRAFT_3864704 [Mycena olivaceomarginata]
MLSDDPANVGVLAGHAPPSILNVCPGQRVDVQVTKPTEDDHAPPPAKPFSDAGNRLGALVSAPSTSSASAAPPAPASNASINPRLEVDTTQSTKSIQTHRAHEHHITHTVGKVRALSMCRPAGRPYTIGTTFPMRVLDPAADARTVKEVGPGGVVVVQSWA